MKGVIKQSEFVSVIGIAPVSGMRTPVFPGKDIDNGEIKQSAQDEGVLEVPVISEEELERQRIREEQHAEFERIKEQFIGDCEVALDEAKVEAEEIIKNAKREASLLLENTEKDSENIRKTAEETGYAAGFTKGEAEGYEKGFKEGKGECRETLEELNGILSRIDGEKDMLFKEYENKLFDLIFTISNKITAGSLNQKDKSVISKMLKEAAKNFRGSSYIKVSLSKLDVEESVNVDIEDLSRIFAENQHIEFEILKDAPKGTLILDNGSEITDAGILTQLKMLEDLGKGKFRNKPEED